MVILVVRGHARLSKQGYILTVRTPVRDEKTGEKRYQVKTRVPLIDLEMLVIVGSRAAVTTGLILALAKAGIPVLIHGREAEAAIYTPFLQATAEARIAQVKALETGAGLEAAKQFIEAKLRGLANLALYLAQRDNQDPQPARQLQQDAKTRVYTARNQQQLLHVEAELTKKAWNILRQHIPSNYGFTARNPRAGDPVNSAINYSYAILYTLATHALTAAGLDPHIGFLHANRPARKSLVYDYTEQFKPLAVHAVITTARRHRLETGEDGYLTSQSLEKLTKTIYTLLKRKPTGRTKTNRAYIYTKAWELRNTLTKATKYTPYTYNPR